MKVHDQYVIEIEEIIRGYMNKEEDPAHITEPLAKIKGFNALVFDKNGLNKIKKVDEDFCIKYLQESGWMERHDRAISSPWRRWEKVDTDREVYICPRCCRATNTRTNFCSYCGLDMRSEEL